MISDSLIHQLRGRGFLAERFETGAQAKEAALALIGTRSVGIGGSITVRDLGLPEALTAQGNKIHAHWYASPEELPTVRHEALHADVYLCSANAVLTDGRLVNIDGTGNRVAGLIYGPPVLIVIAGSNKIAESLDEGIARIRRECCPGNAWRLGLDTPCARTGKCVDCRTPARMCNVITIHEAPTRAVKEFHVFLTDEPLGL